MKSDRVVEIGATDDRIRRACAESLGHKPVFVSVDGETGPDPLAIAPRPLRFSLAKLALNLTNPGLEFEYAPTPWVGVERRLPWIQWPPVRASDPAELPRRFDDAVARAIGDAETVCVAFSGGLDSLAVLISANRICRRDGRRVVAQVLDMEDDRGVSAAAVARRLIHELEIPCECHVVDSDPRELPDAMWSRYGPRTESAPRLTRALNDRAAAIGAGVILTGSGGDELFTAPRFLAGTLLRRGRFADALSYFVESMRADGLGTPMGELLAAVAPFFPAELAFRTYLAVASPELSPPVPCPILTPRFEGFAHEYFRRWYRERLRAFVAAGRDWPASFTYDWIFARNVGVPGAEVPEASPFIDPSLVAFAIGLPPHSLYAAARSCPYHRWKAPILALLPAHYHAALPRQKQTFAAALMGYARAVLADRELLSVELGLLESGAADRIFDDLRLPLRIVEVEQWLAGALDAGAAATAEPA